MSDSIYELTQVIKRYGERTVLQIERLSLNKGEIFALVGPSGAGKSTLLRLLAFLERPAQGKLCYLGRAAGESWPDLEARRRATMVFQRPQLLSRSVRDNITYGLTLRGRLDAHQRRVMEATAEALGLTQLLDAAARTLSGGEMQRTALARALVLEPDVLLLDEPTANLDPYNIQLIEQIIEQANQQGTTIVIVTHNVFQAKRLAQRTGLLINGRLVEVAETAAFFENPTQAQTRAFVRGDLVY